MEFYLYRKRGIAQKGSSILNGYWKVGLFSMNDGRMTGIAKRLNLIMFSIQKFPFDQGAQRLLRTLRGRRKTPKPNNSKHFRLKLPFDIQGPYTETKSAFKTVDLRIKNSNDEISADVFCGILCYTGSYGNKI